MNSFFFESNKLSHLHNGHDIFFCKTDFLLKDFDEISGLDNEVSLISVNSDYPITDALISIAPQNIKKWFATNCITNSDITVPIPLGLENIRFSQRDGHGIGYPERGAQKEYLLQRGLSAEPSKFLYANFNISTNPSYRTACKEMCKSLEYIDFENSVLPLEVFFDRILEYKLVFCPIGNGIDTHRLWEVLYSNRIPVTVKVGDFKIYELYKKLPIVILDSIEDLSNKDLIEQKVLELNYDNLEILNINYWITEIKKSTIHKQI
jgi:hypothetical protein